jgi:hypothetical protein
MAALKLQRGDRVRIKNKGLEGIVVEEKTRTVTVRIVEASGETRERQIPIDDVERLPTRKERLLETPSTRPVPIMAFTAAPNRWYGIDDAHVRADRAEGWLTALRTMYHELSGNGIDQSVALLGFHHRRVLTISALSGHEIYQRMQNAWDDHKMVLEHHDIPEKRTLEIMHVAYVSGAARLAEEPTYAFAFVSVTAPPAEMPRFTESAKALFTGRNTLKVLEGGAIFANDEDGRELLFTRWSDREAAQAFANDARNHVILPPTEQLGDEAEVYDVKVQLVP